MADNSFQNDFFESQIREKKGKKPRLLDKYAKRRVLPYVRISVEYTVIGAIGILVLMIVAYVIGVERGKRISVAGEIAVPEVFQGVKDKDMETRNPKSETRKSDDESETIVAEPMAEAATAAENVRTKEQEEAKKTVTKELMTDDEQLTAELGPAYVVQLATFRGGTSARREIGRLEKKGVRASVIEKGQWFLVYAEGYKTIGEARTAKQKFTKEYKDCYIKRIR